MNIASLMKILSPEATPADPVSVQTLGHPARSSPFTVLLASLNPNVRAASGKPLMKPPMSRDLKLGPVADEKDVELNDAQVPAVTMIVISPRVPLSTIPSLFPLPPAPNRVNTSDEFRAAVKAASGRQTTIIGPEHAAAEVVVVRQVLQAETPAASATRPPTETGPAERTKSGSFAHEIKVGNARIGDATIAVEPECQRHGPDLCTEPIRGSRTTATEPDAVKPQMQSPSVNLPVDEARRFVSTNEDASRTNATAPDFQHNPVGAISVARTSDSTPKRPEFENKRERQESMDSIADGALTDAQAPEIGRAVEAKPVSPPESRQTITWDEALHQVATEGGREVARVGRAEFHFQVSPPEMGPIRVRLAVAASGVTAELKVSTSAIQQIVEGRLPELRHRLEAAGVAVSGFNVTHDGGTSADSRRPSAGSWDEQGERHAPVRPAARRLAAAARTSGSVDVTA